MTRPRLVPQSGEHSHKLHICELNFSVPFTLYNVYCISNYKKILTKSGCGGLPSTHVSSKVICCLMLQGHLVLFKSTK